MRLHSTDARLSVAGRISMVKKTLYTLTWRLHKDLSNEVSGSSRKEVMGICGVICGSKSLLVDMVR